MLWNMFLWLKRVTGFTNPSIPTQPCSTSRWWWLMNDEWFNRLVQIWFKHSFWLSHSPPLSRNRRKIAKYKAAAAASLRRPEGEELLTLKEFQGHSPALSAKGGVCPSPGEIVVTWRDGNVSTLYPDPLLEEQRDEQEKKEEYLEHFPDTEESMRDECVVNGELGVCNQEGLNGKTEWEVMERLKWAGGLPHLTF